jgi:Kiwa protein KwaB-like
MSKANRADSLESIHAALVAASSFPDDAPTRVSLFTRTLADENLEGYSLNLGQKLAGDFRATADLFGSRLLEERTLTEYVPGRKPDEYELPWLLIEDVADLNDVTEAASAETPMELFDPDSPGAGRLRFAVVSIRRSTQLWVHFVRETSVRSRLTKSGKIAAILTGGVYDRLEEDVLLFDQRFDAIVSDEFVFLANQRQFERSLAFTEEAGKAAQSTLVAVTANVDIENKDELLAAAGKDTNMIAKLRGIQAKVNASPAYLTAMTTQHLVQFIKGRPDLEIEVVGTAGTRSLCLRPIQPADGEYSSFWTTTTFIPS